MENLANFILRGEEKSVKNLSVNATSVEFDEIGNTVILSGCRDSRPLGLLDLLKLAAVTGGRVYTSDTHGNPYLALEVPASAVVFANFGNLSAIC